MKAEKGVSAVIPNYNGEELLPQILPTLMAALDQTKLPYEVIISDDCSSDKSLQFVQDNYPQIIILKNDTNRGFSPTINKGIFAAKYDAVLLLNSDVKLTPDYLNKLLPYLDRPDTFGVAGRIIGWDDDKIQDGGKYPYFHGVKIKTSGNYIPLDPDDHSDFFSMYLSGANALVSREKITALGGFNELFAPFYVEDYELSVRAWRSGLKCYYEHNAVCMHRTSSSIKKKTAKNEIRKIYYRNKMYLHALHLSGFRLFLWYLQLIPETLIHLFTLRFWYLSSLSMFIASLSEVKRCKKEFVKKAMQLNGKPLSFPAVAALVSAALARKKIHYLS